MPDADVPAATLATVEVIAGAIRTELGEEIDAYPGLRSPEGADPLNRAFRAAVRALLAADGHSGPALAALVSRALRLVAERRLAAGGRDADRVRDLTGAEPGSPDDWLCFLALSSDAQIEPPPDPDPA